MTTPAAPTGAATDTPDDDPTDDPADPTTDPDTPTDPEPPKGNEAARYRVRLREVETERDTIAERLDGYRRRECEAVVADLLAQPADLWDIGAAELAAFFDDDGAVNEDELRSAANELLKARPGLAASEQALASATPRHRQWGQHSDGHFSRGGTSWSSVIKPS